jgi:hypothetical protein
MSDRAFRSGLLGTLGIFAALVIIARLLNFNTPYIPEDPDLGSSAIGGDIPFDTTINTIHVLVALCDNKYQGIVKVPARIGNGQDPDNNLYWGNAYGVRTYFNKSKEWKFIRSQKNISDQILERVVFKHVSKNYYLVADGYDGRYIKECTIDFLNSTSGQLKDTVQVYDKTIGIGGNARMVSLIGHNGLMDFDLPALEANKDGRRRDCIILACASKPYFSPHIKKAAANPILWTSNLMGPEAYTLHDALSAYINKESTESIRTKAATVYAKYTKCSVKAAKNLLVTGW